MATITSVQDIASEASGWFKTATRPSGESFTRMKDDAPEWVGQMVHAAHGDMLPDDWRYACIRAAVDHIADTSEADADACHEFADAYVDVYTSALTDWLGSHVNRPGYCDEAAEEYGGEPDGINQRIMLGQYAEASEVFYAVSEALLERFDEVEDEDA
jgi:hypothetical protein